MPVLVPAPANMNYANLIEEKNLKKTFIIATLVSTLVGTFAASHNLYERFTQQKRDGAQDEAIKGLSEKIDKLQVNNGGGGNGGAGAGSQQQQQGGQVANELRVALDTSGAVIRREYDYGLDRLGRRYAMGDLMAENELQRQVITLQQTVIRVLEDALYNHRPVDAAALDRLLWASRAARDGSLDALRSQYQRLLLALPPPPPPSRPPQRGRGQDFVRVMHSDVPKAREPTPGPPPRRRLLGPPPPPPLSPPPQRGYGQVTRVTEVVSKKANKKPDSNHDIGVDLFCRYSLDLQRMSDMALSRTFDPPEAKQHPPAAPRGSRHHHHHPGPHCPACREPLAVDATDEWAIEIPVLRVPRGRSRSRSRGRRERGETIKRFRIPARFVIKCHTPEGDFLCALCCGRQNVVFCEDAEALVDHVAREHRIGDIEREWDILAG